MMYLVLHHGIEAIVKAAQDLRNEGLYTPPSIEGSVHYPSAIGGANWGGPAVDSFKKYFSC